MSVATSVDDLPGADVILATAAKWATVRDRRWTWAIVDEAYQMRSDMLLLIADRFDRAVFVGDPGQLDPFSVIETTRWVGLPWDPMQSAVAVVLAHNPDLPVHRLPVSWRLPASAAGVVSGAFYPFTGFRAATGPGTRQLTFTTAGMRSREDATLEMAAQSGWALHELPARHVIRTDAAAAGAAAALAARLLTRRAVGTCERHPGGQPLGPRDIAIGVAHRDQADQIRQALTLTASPAARESGSTPPTGFRAQSSPSPSSSTPCPGAATPPTSTSKQDGSASWPPGTGTPASWSPARASPTCSTPTPQPTPSTSA